MVPVALGNDGMGSLRIPAANCGLVTLKPGHGVVPAGIGNGDWFGMAENGPLATTVEDLRLMLGVLAGTDLQGAQEAPRRRIAAAVRSPLAGVSVSGSYTTAVREAAGVLARAGHRVRRAEPPYPLSLGVTALRHWTAGTAVDAEGLDRARLARRTRVHAAVGRRFVQSVRTGDGREHLRARLTPFFTEHDVLLTPALARHPPRPARGTNAAGCATCWPTPRTPPSPRPGT
jgi:amidase